MARASLELASVACLMCVALGGLATYRESAALTYGVQGGERIYERIRTGDISLGYSYYSKKRVMVSCLDGMSPFSMAVRAPEQSEAFVKNCQALSADILASTPVDSLAWAVTARVASVVKDAALMNSALMNSQATAPSAEWLATIRVGISEANYGLLDQANKDVNAKDLGVLVVSNSGVAAIADRYWKVPEFKERITTVVSALPDYEQARFLAYIRRAAK
ncbi:hypothetical protein SAMN05880593_1284 [Rhizobium sp. RU36D]|nr:hypothetical protein SAMN05880593_1284 [Rhizobium sp. RU36D]